MVSAGNKKYAFLGLAAAVVAAAVTVNLALQMWGRYVSIDLTVGRLYSLTPETRAFLAQNEEPVVIRLYMSEDLDKKNPKLGQYAGYLRRILAEYQLRGRGLIKVDLVGIKPFSSSEAEALKAGVEPFEQNNPAGKLYLGIAMTNAGGRSLAIRQMQPERQAEAEADLSRMLSVLARKEPVVVGVLSPYFNITNENREGFSKPFVARLAESGYQIRNLPVETPLIPAAVDVVLVYYPLQLGPAAVYALDQYLMRGGSVIMFLDALAEERFRNGRYQPYDSGVQALLRQAGIFYSDNIVAGDSSNSRDLVLDGHKIKYPFWLELGEKQIKNHLLTKGLQKLSLNYSGFFETGEVDGLKTTVLAATGNNSGVMAAGNAAGLTYDRLMEKYRTTTTEYPLVLLSEGRFSSVFETPFVENSVNLPPFLKAAVNDGRLLVVGDADMLEAVLWNSRAKEKYRPYDGTSLNDNWYFLRNAVDYLSGSGYVAVPRRQLSASQDSLAAVLQRLAADKYRDRYRQIVTGLQELGRKATALQSDGASPMLMSIRQSKRLEQLKREQLEAELELRRIQYMTAESFEDYLAGFKILVTFLLPFAAVLPVWAIYRMYAAKIRRQAKEYGYEKE